MTQTYLSKGNQTFINNYLKYEKASELSREEICKRADINPKKLDIILEKGFHGFNLMLVQDLSIALGCTMEDLIGVSNTDSNVKATDITTWEDLALEWRTLSHNLSYYMKLDDWTYNTLSTTSGVRVRSIEGIISGATGYLGPNVAVIVRLARALGIKPGDLLGKKEYI